MTTRPEPPPTTHPGLAYLRARAALNDDAATTREYDAFQSADRLWRSVGCPVDLVPQADISALVTLCRDALAAEAAAKAEQRLLTARVAACDAEILRLEAENRRLTRGVRGWVRAWLGAR